MLHAFQYPFFPEVYSFYIVKTPTNWEQIYTEHVLILVSEVKGGELTFCIGKNEYKVKQGDLLFAKKGVCVKRICDMDVSSKLYYVHIKLQEERGNETEEKNNEELIQKYIAKNQFGVKVSNEESLILVEECLQTGDLCPLLIKELEDIHTKSRLHQMGYSYYINSCLMKLLGLASMKAVQDHTAPQLVIDTHQTNDKRINKLTNYIYNNISQQITLKTLSREFYFSPQYIISLFKKHLNTTPIKYINSIKMLYAKEIMRRYSFSVKEIAQMVGFENPHYFSRVFRSVAGCTPSQYQARILRKKKPKKDAEEKAGGEGADK